MEQAIIKESLGEDEGMGFVFGSENGIEGKVMAVRVANFLRQRYEATVGQFEGDEQYPADDSKWIVTVVFPK